MNRIISCSTKIINQLFMQMVSASMETRRLLKKTAWLWSKAPKQLLNRRDNFGELKIRLETLKNFSVQEDRKERWTGRAEEAATSCVPLLCVSSLICLWGDGHRSSSDGLNILFTSTLLKTHRHKTLCVTWPAPMHGVCICGDMRLCCVWCFRLHSLYLYDLM